MNQFKTPEEAIAACDNECDLAWEKFAIANNIIEAVHPENFRICKSMFRAGYMNGAKFVSGYIIGNLVKYAKEHQVIEPTEPTPIIS